MFRRRLILFTVTLVVVALIGVGFYATWERHSYPRTVRDAAESSRVDIPDAATEVSATYDRNSIRDGCSTLSFLLPNAQWRSYVGKYTRETPIPTTSQPWSKCAPIPHDCVDAIGSSLTGYEAADFAGNNLRALVVIPDCEPGKTLIAWSASDI